MRIDWKYLGVEFPPSKSSGNWKTTCVKCRDSRGNPKDKSLSINLDTGEFMCHHCNWSGRAVVEDQWVDIVPKRPKVYTAPPKRVSAAPSGKSLTWFEGRGISLKTLNALRVTEGREVMPRKDGTFCEMNTVQFNYYLNGELINTKFRTGEKCFKMVKGARLIPYNIDSIKGKSECIITEGEIDAMSFVEVGYPWAVSVPSGANRNTEWLDDFLEGYFDDKDTIYIAVDTDAKGLELRDELLRRLGADRCRVVTFGDCKDANDHLQKYGKGSLIKCLENAPETKIEGVFSVRDFEDKLDLLYEQGVRRGKTLGYPTFDSLISFETGRLCVVTGIPSSGKSEFIDQMAERLNIRYGWRFAYFSPENAPLEYHARKLIEKFIGKECSVPKMSREEFEMGKSHLADDFSFIYPKTDFRLDTILTCAAGLVRRRGIKCLVIDPYNKLEDEAGSSETRYVSRMLDKLATFAQRHDVLVILMAHPTKMPKDKDGKQMIPTMYDISGSAHFYNKADFGIIVHRDREADEVIVKAAKVKFRHFGQGGETRFKYNLENGRYAEKNYEQDNSNHLLKAMEAEQTEGMPLPVFDDECPF